MAHLREQASLLAANLERVRSLKQQAAQLAADARAAKQADAAAHEVTLSLQPFQMM